MLDFHSLLFLQAFVYSYSFALYFAIGSTLPCTLFIHAQTIQSVNYPLLISSDSILNQRRCDLPLLGGSHGSSSTTLQKRSECICVYQRRQEVVIVGPSIYLFFSGMGGAYLKN